MTITHSKPLKRLLTGVIFSLIGAVISSQQAIASDKQWDLKVSDTIKVLEFSKNLKIRGFKVSKGIYMGQAKVAGHYGLGVVVEHDSFSWGINNRGASILKRF